MYVCMYQTVYEDLLYSLRIGCCSKLLIPVKDDIVVKKLAQMLGLNVFANMVSRKRDTYRIEPRTYVLFMFELDDEFKSLKIVIK